MIIPMNEDTGQEYQELLLKRSEDEESLDRDFNLKHLMKLEDFWYKLFFTEEN